MMKHQTVTDQELPPDGHPHLTCRRTQVLVIQLSNRAATACKTWGVDLLMKNGINQASKSILSSGHSPPAGTASSFITE